MTAEPPEGLEPYRAAAWDVLAAGGSLADAARAAAEVADRDAPYSAGTVAGWKRRWEADHGPDIFRTERSEVAAAKTEVARQESERRWHELRAQEAVNAGITASQIRAQLLAILPTVGTTRVDRGPDGTLDPVVVHGPAGRQIRDLAAAYADLLRAAELLEDRPTLRTARTVEGILDLADTGPDLPAGILDALEAPTDDEEITLEAARMVVRRFRPTAVPDPTEVIETSEAS